MPATAAARVPTVLVLRSDETIPVTERLAVEKLVEVALVVVALVAVNVESVEEAVDRKPFSNARVVEVACSPEPSLVKGQAKVEAAGKAVLQSPEIQRMVVEAYWEDSRVVEAFVTVRLVVVKFVEVAFVVVAEVAVNVVSVEEAVETNPALNSSVVEVAFSPVPNFTNG